MKNTALVVIDLQNDITKNYKKIIGQVNEAIDWAAANEMHMLMQPAVSSQQAIIR